MADRCIPVQVNIVIEDDGHCSRACYFLKSVGSGNMSNPMTWHCKRFGKSLSWERYKQNKYGFPTGDWVKRCGECLDLTKSAVEG